MQGPFDVEQMKDWYYRGFLKIDLPVRAGEGGSFTPLHELFDDMNKAFRIPHRDNTRSGDCAVMRDEDKEEEEEEETAHSNALDAGATLGDAAAGSAAVAGGGGGGGG